MNVKWVLLIIGIEWNYLVKGNSQVCESAVCKKTAKHILEYMDTRVNPCKDFYKFVCGKYSKKKIPEDETKVNSFIEISVEVAEQLRTLFRTNPQSGENSVFNNVRAYYALCEDEDSINARGVRPALDLLQSAGGWPLLDADWSESNWTVLEVQKKLNSLMHDDMVFIQIAISPSLHDSSKRVIFVDQPELGLPKEYLSKGVTNAVVQAYKKYMMDVAALYGAEDSEGVERQVDDVLEFEMALANITTDKEERRDFQRMNNIMTLRELKQRWDWLDWKALVESLLPPWFTLSEDEEIVVIELAYMDSLRPLVEIYPARTVANYMMWRASMQMTAILTTKILDEHMDLMKVLSGQQTKKPRWRFCLERVKSKLSAALSSLYVRKYFNLKSRNKAIEMVERIRDAMKKTILKVPWMQDKTKITAYNKSSDILEFIGFPVELIQEEELQKLYKDLKMNTTHFFEASLDLMKWETYMIARRLREPVNKTDWRDRAAVTEVNAYYNPTENSITFPAAILQPPFFHADLPWYMNYGAIGAVIGHEITHGFDDQGRQFTADGNLGNWWDEKSKENFDKQKQCIIDQYSSYFDVNANLSINGINTQGENIADIGGLKLAYNAFKEHEVQLAKQLRKLPGLEKYSSDQMLLISLANMWCSKSRVARLVLQIRTDEHPPEEFRVRGMMENFPHFSDIFGCGCKLKRKWWKKLKQRRKCKSASLKKKRKNNCSVW